MTENQHQRPGEEAILAFLFGNATEREVLLIEDALASSPEFREHFAYTANVLAPMRSQHSEAAEPSHPSPDVGALFKRAKERMMERIPVGEWFGLTTLNSVGPALVRGADEPENHREAAAILFGGALEEKDGKFSLRSTVAVSLSESSSRDRDSERNACVYLSDAEGEHVITLRAPIPMDAGELTVWFLALPGLELQSAKMPSDRIKLPIDPGSQACVTFTFELDGTIMTTTALAVGLENDPDGS